MDYDRDVDFKFIMLGKTTISRCLVDISRIIVWAGNPETWGLPDVSLPSGQLDFFVEPPTKMPRKQ